MTSCFLFVLYSVVEDFCIHCLMQSYMAIVSHLSCLNFWYRRYHVRSDLVRKLVITKTLKLKLLLGYHTGNFLIIHLKT